MHPGRCLLCWRPGGRVSIQQGPNCSIGKGSQIILSESRTSVSEPVKFFVGMFVQDEESERNLEKDYEMFLHEACPTLSPHYRFII